MQKEEKTQKEKNFKGFPLFNEIEDESLRKRNQAVIMVNILEDSFVNGKCSAKGASLIAGYMNRIPDRDKRSVLDEFTSQARDRGFQA